MFEWSRRRQAGNTSWFYGRHSPFTCWFSCDSNEVISPVRRIRGDGELHCAPTPCLSALILNRLVCSLCQETKEGDGAYYAGVRRVDPDPGSVCWGCEPGSRRGEGRGGGSRVSTEQQEEGTINVCWSRTRMRKFVELQPDGDVRLTEAELMDAAGSFHYRPITLQYTVIGNFRRSVLLHGKHKSVKDKDLNHLMCCKQSSVADLAIV